MRLRIRHLEEVASTNIEVKRAIDAGEPEGLVVRADRQTGGYGRQGRVWESPEGGLYFSLLLRPEVVAGQLPTLALLAGIAVRRALARLVGDGAAGRIELKWPNDIVLSCPESNAAAIDDGATADGSSDKDAAAANVAATTGAAFAKLCGISSEARNGAACVGIGVNVHPPVVGTTSFAAASSVAGASVPVAKNAPVYLVNFASEPASQEDLRDLAFSLILEEFAPSYGWWCAQGFAPFVSEYTRHDALRGRRIDVVDRAGVPLTSGVAAGVSSDGCLLVKSGDGSLTPVTSGEAHIL